MKLENIKKSDRISLIAEQEARRSSPPPGRLRRLYGAVIAARDAIRACCGLSRER